MSLENTLNFCAAFILSVFACCVAIWIMGVGLDRQSIHECENWKALAETNKYFYLVGWQDEQCRAVGVNVEAPVIPSVKNPK